MKKELKLTVTANENWVSNHEQFQKYTCSILNTQEDISSWKISLTFENSIEISDFWNCQIEVKDCYLLITSVSYNSTVKVNQNISNIGFILKSQKDIILNKQKIEEV